MIVSLFDAFFEIGAKHSPFKAILNDAPEHPAGRRTCSARVQPVAVASFLMSALWLGAKGTVTAETAKFFVMGLPCLLAGTWLGLKLFGRIDEATFRKIVLALLFVSGVTLMV
jgi:uncharacterized membrane protein YfcA